MAEGLSNWTAAAILNAIGNASPFSVANVYVQLHVGPPGADGTANQAVEQIRIQAQFAVASSGVMTNDVGLTWNNIAGAQDPTHFSAWDAPTGGLFLFSGLVDSAAYAAGNTLSVPTGGLALSFMVAS